jgi:hypothetical protein
MGAERSWAPGKLGPAGRGIVRISGPRSVVSTVCSKWAEGEPSAVTTVQPSPSVFVL